MTHFMEKNSRGMLILLINRPGTLSTERELSSLHWRVGGGRGRKHIGFCGKGGVDYLLFVLQA